MAGPPKKCCMHLDLTVLPHWNDDDDDDGDDDDDDDDECIGELSQHRFMACELFFCPAIYYIGDHMFHLFPMISPLYSHYIPIWLVVWNSFIFHNIWDVILPIDFHIFERGGSTTNQIIIVIGLIIH